MTAKKKPSAKKAEPETGLPAWVKLPLALILIGAVIAIVGIFMGEKTHLAHAWLVSFMFYLSICLGGFFLVLLHYLLDTHWIVPIRRIAEHLACLLPLLAVFFVPIALFSGSEFVTISAGAKASEHEKNNNAIKAEKKAAEVHGEKVEYKEGESDHAAHGPDRPRAFYSWMQSEKKYYASVPNETHDHAWHAKRGYLSTGFWHIRWVLCFVIWGVFTWLMRKHSLAQDSDGDAKWTGYNRKLAAAGIFVFAATLTIGAIDWMKGLEHQWFSTMYGVYYFAGSVWVSLITIYVIALRLKTHGPLKDVVQKKTLKDNATLFFAFTVFYAYIHFSQYFLIWNASIPEETFWYVKREQGPWWWVGMLIIFGHFFVPFLALLRQDVKVRSEVMITVAVLAWFIHFCDMSYNIMPLIHESSGWMRLIWIDLGCLLLMGGCLSIAFLYFFKKHPPYPQRDPRIAETMGVYVKLHSEAKVVGK